MESPSDVLGISETIPAGISNSKTDDVDSCSVDAISQQEQQQDIGGSSQELNSNTSTINVSLSSNESDHQDQAESQAQIVWLPNDYHQNQCGQSTIGLLPPVSEVVSNQRLTSNRAFVQNNPISYHPIAVTLEMGSSVTGINNSDVNSTNVYSVAPSSVAGSHALTSDTNAHHYQQLVHQANQSSHDCPTSSLPNFAEVTAGRAELLPSSNINDHVQFYESQDIKVFESFVEMLPCYKCRLCAYISLSRDVVEQHVRLNHSKSLMVQTTVNLEKQLTVDLPDKSVVSSDLERPEIIKQLASDHKYICGVCGKAFDDIDTCRGHLNYAHHLQSCSVHLEPSTDANHPLYQDENLHQQEIQNFVGKSEESSVIIDTQDMNIEMDDTGGIGTDDLDDRLRKVTDIDARVVKQKRKKMSNDVETSATRKVILKSRKRNATKKLVATVITTPSVESGDIVINDSIKTDRPDAHLIVPTIVSTKKRTPRKSPVKNVLSNEHVDNNNITETDEVLTGQRCDKAGCMVWLRSAENLEYHRKCHADVGFDCAECLEHFDRWKTLGVHLWREHHIDMELFTCDLCNYKTYSYSKLMNLHRRIHSDERPYLCDVCGKGFKTSRQLRNHKVIHSERKPQRKLRSGECDVCHRYFSDKRMLRVHKDTVHHKLRPYLCTYCGYAASCRSTLKMHVRQHTGEKPFACDVCDYRTADHNSLRRHKMRHSGEKPYKCPFCPYACIQSSTYKAHLKNKHPGMDSGLMFCCDQCTFKTIKKENFAAHMADHASSSEWVPKLTKISGPTGAAVADVCIVLTQPVAASSEDLSTCQPSEVADSDEQFIFTGLDDVQQQNIDQQVYKLNPENQVERFPILAGHLKEEHGSPSSLSTGDMQSLKSSQQETDVVMQGEPQSIETLDALIGHCRKSNKSRGEVDDNLLNETNPSNSLTADDLEQERTTNLTENKDQEDEELLTHTQLTPVPPTEIISIEC